jgi:photosystem II stability/assembly factor-like uncharacterized protein
MVRRMGRPWWVAAVVLLAAGCASVGSNAAGVGVGATARTSPSASSSTTGSAPQTTLAAQTGAARKRYGPIWLQSLQMTSPTTGWALYYSKNPNSSSEVFMLLARTTDGGRTWTDVTPAPGLPLLATPYAEQALDPVNGEDAYLAVTGATQESNNSVNTTVVFATTDGGRTWTQSVPLRAVSTASQVSFADPEHGFLLFGGDGGAMGEDQVWLYRTADGGKHWSLAAASPAEPGAAVTAQQGSGRIPTECDKHALNFPTATMGWIDSTCNAFLANALLVSHDDGSSWSDQSLPLPATTCAGACFVTGPQFVGGVGFVTIAPWPGTPALLETRDQGETWEQIALPSGVEYPQITFFSPTQGVLVVGGSQDSFQSTFYTTANGGQTWTPAPQGTNFTKIGVNIDFTSTQDALAWTTGENSDPSPATSIYQTTNSGRTWHVFIPHLVS